MVIRWIKEAWNEVKSETILTVSERLVYHPGKYNQLFLVEKYLYMLICVILGDVDKN